MALSFFSRDIDVRFYFSAEGEPSPGVSGRNVALCGNCGRIHVRHAAVNVAGTEGTRWWRDAESGNFDAQRFIAKFIVPDRQCLASFGNCRRKAALPTKGWQGWNTWRRKG